MIAAVAEPKAGPIANVQDIRDHAHTWGAIYDRWAVSTPVRAGRAVADEVSAMLEAAGLRCWIAPRDVAPGSHYADHVMSTITGHGQEIEL